MDEGVKKGAAGWGEITWEVTVYGGCFFLFLLPPPLTPLPSPLPAYVPGLPGSTA